MRMGRIGGFEACRFAVVVVVVVDGWVVGNRIGPWRRFIWGREGCGGECLCVCTVCVCVRVLLGFRGNG